MDKKQSKVHTIYILTHQPSVCMYVFMCIIPTCEQELERLQKMDEKQRKVLAARKHVESEILQTKCPSCKAAFHDFVGCFAIKCAS